MTPPSRPEGMPEVRAQQLGATQWDIGVATSARELGAFTEEQASYVVSLVNAQIHANEHFVCRECGPHVRCDEDGCCACCGADCTVAPCNCIQELSALSEVRREQDELIGDVRKRVLAPEPWEGGPALRDLVLGDLDELIRNERDGRVTQHELATAHLEADELREARREQDEETIKLNRYLEDAAIRKVEAITREGELRTLVQDRDREVARLRATLEWASRFPLEHSNDECYGGPCTCGLADLRDALAATLEPQDALAARLAAAALREAGGVAGFTVITDDSVAATLKKLDELRALVREAEQFVRMHGGNTAGAWLEKASPALGDTPPIRNDGWIPVTERVPGSERELVVACGWLLSPVIARFWPGSGDWARELNGDTLSNVTHWMPLPKPPRTGDT